MRPLIPGLAVAVALLGAAALEAQYTPFHHDPKLLLEGNWQSCFDERIGQFAEKIYDQLQVVLLLIV